MTSGNSEASESSPARYLLHRRFEEQARRTPGTTALRAGDRTISYRELEAASERIAGALRACGIGERALVGLHLERSIPFVVAMLGILKANCGVVPLPPSYPESRRREILAYAQLDAVIESESSRMPSGTAARVLDVAELEQYSAAAGMTGAGDPGEAAFVLCTSGSTGQPKMIVRSHRSFFHRLEWTWHNWPYAPSESCCQKSHMTTTHSIYELFEPLLQGVTVNLIADETVRQLERFWETIRTTRVTRLLIVPSVLQASLDMPGFVPPPIRVLVLMGEYVHPRLAGRAIEAFPESTRIYSIYGSTEASSTLVCDVRASYRESDELPLGKPISSDVTVRVLGPSLQPVGVGETGLLHIAGPALFTGYFRNPELTATMFANAAGESERLFNTGDRVRVTADGSIQFVGRVDHTVKVRGFRVDLGEVERAMLQQPEVQQAVAMLAGPANENPPFVAFYAPASSPPSAIATSLRERLPAYMVPSVLVGLESFPLTASGKVDRRRLLEEYVRRATAVPSGESLSSTELRIAEIWKQVLQQRDIDADSHFFEIGGTSLTVFSVVHRLRSAFGLARQQLNDNAVYQYSTLRDLAGYVDSVRQGGPSAPAQAKIAVTLRKGRPDLPPLFVIASSGGTLGAYDRLSKALKTDREIVGIRDPYVWGARDPTMGFQEWIAIYVTAIRERQPAGPYYICAFSSAGAFGYEIAQHLRRAGQEVAQLLLIDPIGIAGEATEDFGYRVFTALFRGRRFKWRVRLEGAWRLLTGAGRRDGLRAGDNDFSMSAEEVERRAVAVRRDRKVIKDLSSLFELNAGLPFTLTDSDFEGRDPVRYVDILLSRVRTVTPDVDLDTVERILVQYYCLQLPATHFYRLKRYGGRVEIFEPASPQVGLLRAYFRPYAKDLRLRVLGIGEPSERIRIACANLSPSLQTHYRSMRDDAFVGNLAAALEPLLSEPLNAVGEVPSSP